MTDRTDKIDNKRKSESKDENEDVFDPEENPATSTVTPDDYPSDDGGKPDYRKPGRS